VKVPARIAGTTLADATVCLGLALAFWEPIMGPVLVGVGFIGKAIGGAFPPATGPTDEMLAKLADLEGRVGRIELGRR
jgi:hypothetical protein